MQEELTQKFEMLRDILKSMQSVVVAYSGGVDSSLLAKAAYDILNDKALVVTAVSETYPQGELQKAADLANQIGIKHMVIRSHELDNEDFAQNPVNRCYYCKSELFTKLTAICRDKGFQYVADGSNLDDQNDYRPGLLAVQELGIRSPLREAGLTKNDIRELSRELGLSTWERPSLACLSSRLPYGERITVAKLKQIELAENFLRELGFRELRVRYHQNIARLELPRKDFGRLTSEVIDMIINHLKELGFVYISLDLQGLRSGSMNEALPNLRQDAAKAEEPV